MSKRPIGNDVVVVDTASKQKEGDRFPLEGRTVQGALQACVPASDDKRDVTLVLATSCIMA